MYAWWTPPRQSPTHPARTLIQSHIARRRGSAVAQKYCSTQLSVLAKDMTTTWHTQKKCPTKIDGCGCTQRTSSLYVCGYFCGTASATGLSPIG